MDDILLLAASTLGATLRLATPLLLCALAGLLSERSGVVDMGLEGKMLGSAFAAAAVAHLSGSGILGLAAGMAVGVIMAGVHGFATITHKGDQVVSGMALNLIAAGLTVVLGLQWFGRGGKTPDLPPNVRFGPLFADATPQAGGQAWTELVLQHNVFVWIAVGLVPATSWLLMRTRFGLRLRAVGDNPAMIDAAGISVAWLRWRAVLLGGMLCGMAGTYLSCAQNAAFSPHMSAGMGFIALAAMIFGRWQPWPTLGACLLFGLLDAIAIRLQGVVLPGVGVVPVQFIQVLPYAFTVVLLAGVFGRSRAPAALGVAFYKGR